MEITNSAGREKREGQTQAVRNEVNDDGPKAEEQNSSATENADNEANYEDFKLSLAGKFIFFTLAVLTLMVSLDGTSISVALPVFPL